MRQLWIRSAIFSDSSRVSTLRKHITMAGGDGVVNIYNIPDPVKYINPQASAPSDDADDQGEDLDVACHEFWCSKVTTFSVFTLALVITGFVLIATFANQQPAPSTALILGIVLATLTWFVRVVVLCIFDHTFRFLSNSAVITDIRQLVKSVQDACPALVWTMSCYHYETRSRRVASTDSKVVWF